MPEKPEWKLRVHIFQFFIVITGWIPLSHLTATIVFLFQFFIVITGFRRANDRLRNRYSFNSLLLLQISIAKYLSVSAGSDFQFFIVITQPPIQVMLRFPWTLSFNSLLLLHWGKTIHSQRASNRGSLSILYCYYCFWSCFIVYDSLFKFYLFRPYFTIGGFSRLHAWYSTTCFQLHNGASMLRSGFN